MYLKHVKNVDVEDEYIKVTANDSVFEIIKRMVDETGKHLDHEGHMVNRILAAYVLDKGGAPIGVIYKNDIIKFIADGKDPKVLKAKDIMNPPFTLNVTNTILDAVNAILDKGLLTIAVLDGKKLSHVISVFDVIYLDDTLDDITSDK